MSNRDPWLRFGMDAWRLGQEASLVIGLRAMTLAAGGPAAQVEAYRMLAEKLDTGLALQLQLLSGALGTTPAIAGRRAVAKLRRKVRANRTRLSKP